MARLSRDEYSASLTKSSLKAQEVRIIAALLQEGRPASEVVETVVAENLLQKRSTNSTRTLVNYHLRRLYLVTPAVIQVAANGSFREATQATLVAALSESRLLRDFFTHIRAVLQSGRRFLAASDWITFLDWLEGQDPSVARWTPVVRSKLRQNIWRILAESEVTDSTKHMRLQAVRMEPSIRECLKDASLLAVSRALEAGGFE